MGNDHYRRINSCQKWYKQFMWSAAIFGSWWGIRLAHQEGFLQKVLSDVRVVDIVWIYCCIIGEWIGHLLWRALFIYEFLIFSVLSLKFKYLNFFLLWTFLIIIIFLFLFFIYFIILFLFVCQVTINRT